jgi:hypothetical protein
MKKFNIFVAFCAAFGSASAMPICNWKQFEDRKPVQSRTVLCDAGRDRAECALELEDPDGFVSFAWVKVARSSGWSEVLVLSDNTTPNRAIAEFKADPRIKAVTVIEAGTLPGFEGKGGDKPGCLVAASPSLIPAGAGVVTLKGD